VSYTCEHMKESLTNIISRYGVAAKSKLSNPGAAGEPEEQLRAPFERLLTDFADLLGIGRSRVVAVGESSLRDLKTRPDYAVTVDGALVGFIELKAPGKGANPNRFRDAHDKAQWEKLRSLPNVLYTDGNSFSLWRDGELVDAVVTLAGDVETSGAKLEPTPGLGALFESFFSWHPIPPRNAKDLAKTTARLCRFLRDEVAEQLAHGSAALTSLATDWRQLLFPDATDERFADGYAQAVTFGLLMARAKDIRLATGLHQVATELSKTSSLIGAALELLTHKTEEQATLQTSVRTLVRVLDEVSWASVSRSRADAWLYFYENFLEVYDNNLRKQTGSYYTPPEVVGAMVRMVDDVLRSERFRLHAGLASPAVTLADPATGTGTFLLGVLRKIAETVEADEGSGAVRGAIDAAVQRLIAFEMQLGPFAVAQLRILAEIVELTGAVPSEPLRMFVTDTLGDPHDDEAWIPGMLAPIADSRKAANKIKREEPITVVLGNPPYKEKAKGLGGWIEGQRAVEAKRAPLADWIPPRDWGVGAHTKHLRNLYVYFWRWATWKVFDHHPKHSEGIVCFITVAGFLAGPGFQRMREYLRQTCHDIWVIDCSPEGHQPEVNTRIFQAVQQPVCIVLASRSSKSDRNVPAAVRFRSLPAGHRDEKFHALAKVRIDDRDWIDCPTDWRAPFLPASTGAWATYPRLDQMFVYNGSGVMPGRTWVIAPDAESLERRWKALIQTPKESKEELFHPHILKEGLGDRHIHKILREGLPGYDPRPTSIAEETTHSVQPVKYAFRSFDRQWIIPDNRLINRPNPELWAIRSNEQIFLTAPSDRSPTAGPALTFAAAIPDLHHYNGRGGRVFPLWRVETSAEPNFPPKLLPFLAERLGRTVSPEDFLAYIAAIAAHPAFTERFHADLTTPGLRIPITADANAFAQAVDIGRTVIWLHTFGERMADPDSGRPAQPPRLPQERRPRIPAAGAIPQDPGSMPDELRYDPAAKRLHVGSGFIENIEPAVWYYQVSGKQVLTQWFSYRKKNRERPIIGDRRAPSPLGDIQPEHWLAEYTSELINVLNVLSWLVELEPAQAAILEKICTGPLVTLAELEPAFEPPQERKRPKKTTETRRLFNL
jgi:hypothetical protein